MSLTIQQAIQKRCNGQSLANVVLSDNVENRVIQAIWNVDNGRPHVAISHLLIAIEKHGSEHKKLAVLYHNLGLVWCMLYMIDAAEQCFQRAHDLQIELALDTRPTEAAIAWIDATRIQLTVAVENIQAGHPCTLPHRNILPNLLNVLKLYGSVAEVGVQRGDFAAHILESWHGSKYDGRFYAIDAWQAQPTTDYLDIGNVTQAKHDENYNETRQRLSGFEHVIVMRQTSAAAAALIPDKSLDMIYLDANHSPEHIREDIKLWLPKVRPGGLLGGHDYIQDGLYPHGHFGVMGAVHELLKVKPMPLITTGELDYPSWFVATPK